MKFKKGDTVRCPSAAWGHEIGAVDQYFGDIIRVLIPGGQAACNESSLVRVCPFCYDQDANVEGDFCECGRPSAEYKQFIYETDEFYKWR